MNTANICLEAPDWRARLAARLDLAPVQHLLIGLILINAIILGMETSSAIMANWEASLNIANTRTPEAGQP